MGLEWGSSLWTWQQSNAGISAVTEPRTGSSVTGDLDIGPGTVEEDGLVECLESHYLALTSMSLNSSGSKCNRSPRERV